MNKVAIIGRITADPEVKYTSDTDPLAVLKFTVAVARKKKDETDWINCCAFGKTAEFIGKNFSKGNRIALTGRIQTGSYTNKGGQKVNTTEVVVEDCEFCESKAAAPAPAPAPQPSADPALMNAGFLGIPDSVDSEVLPFL